MTTVAAGDATEAETLVFVNYRSSDTASAAAFIHAQLSGRFGAEAVFLDYESIQLGHDFEPQILERVRRSAVLVAVIGNQWLSGNIGDRPIDRPDDWVRREILEALAHDVPGVPVLIGDGTTIDPARLPLDLRPLAQLQRFEIRTRRQRRDIDILADKLIEQIPRLRHRPVPGLTPWQAVVAAVQTGIDPASGSPVSLAVELNSAGELENVTLRRAIPRASDRLVLGHPDNVYTMAYAAGLRADDRTVQATEDWLEHQARSGRTVVDRDTIDAAVTELGLRTGPPRTVLSIATLKPDPMARDADHALDWVDRFDGDSDYLKRRPLAPATWCDLQTELDAIPQHLPRGRAEVLVTGSIRQATAFTVGCALRMVTGVDVAIVQRGELWSSRTAYATPLEPAVTEHPIGHGDELAVAVAIAADPTVDVLAFLDQTGLPIDRLITYSPAVGIRDNAIPDASAATATAIGIRDAVRRACRASRRVHLFLAGPGGLALLLGHRWNRVQPTDVYEDVRSDLVYEHAFTIDA